MNNHIGGRKHTCPSCSDGMSVARKCMFFNADKSLTRYAFLCGYVQEKRAKNLSMEHGVFHVKGFDVEGKRVWESFDSLTPARRFLNQR
jgi:hypothetical protein